MLRILILWIVLPVLVLGGFAVDQARAETAVERCASRLRQAAMDLAVNACDIVNAAGVLDRLKSDLIFAEDADERAMLEFRIAELEAELDDLRRARRLFLNLYQVAKLHYQMECISAGVDPDDLIEELESQSWYEMLFGSPGVDYWDPELA